MYRRFSLIFLFLGFLPLMFSCGGDDKMNIGGSEATVERGMMQAESPNFVTAVETIDQGGQLKSEFQTEAIGIRVRILNKSNNEQHLMFQDGKRAKIEIFKEGSLVWSTDDLVSIQSIEEEHLRPKDEMKFELMWNKLKSDGRVAEPGMYRIKIADVRAQPKLPVPQNVLEFEIR